jgi:hypothetical protein
MTKDLSHSETIRYIDAGISVHKSDVLASSTPFDANDYFAAGYAKEMVEAGLNKIEHMKAQIGQFVSASIDAESIGQSITVNGVVFTSHMESFNIAIRTGGGKLVALMGYKGLEAPLTVYFGDDFEVYGQTLLRHALVGEEKQRAFLIGTFYPLSLVMAAIGLATRV